jgi:hypothetical protein
MIGSSGGRPESGQGRVSFRSTANLLALSSPLLILLALVSMLSRGPATRLQALPALLIGCGLLLFSLVRRRRRRARLLRVLREPVSGRHDQRPVVAPAPAPQPKAPAGAKGG